MTLLLEDGGGSGSAPSRYLLLGVVQGGPGLRLRLVDHGLADHGVELAELREEAAQVDGAPGLQDAEDAVQHDGGRQLLPFHVLLHLVHKMAQNVIPDFPELPTGPLANNVVILMPV